MKKVIVGALLLLVVAGLGAPFVIGMLMEKTVMQSFDNVNSLYGESGTDLSVEVVRYDRKFFSSEIEWKLSFGSLEPLYGVKDIIFIDRAKHGYTGIISKTSLEKNKWYADFLHNKLDSKDPLTISTEYKLSGPIRTDMALEPFSLMVEDEKLDIKAAKIMAGTDANFTTFLSEGSWEGGSVAEKVEFGAVFFNSELRKISTYLWDGTLSYGIDKIEATEGEQVVTINKLKADYTLDVNEQGNTISIGVGLGVDNVSGGAVKIDDGAFKIGFNNLDGEGFEKFMVMYSEMAGELFKDMAGSEDDPEKMATLIQEQMAQLQLQLMTAYEQLLKKDLEFEISDLHATLPEGEVKGGLQLRLNKDMTFAEFFPLLQQPELVTEIFSFSSDVSLPAVLVGENPMLLTPVYPGMQGGLFVSKGDTLVHKAETRDGKLYINDLELEL